MSERSRFAFALSIWMFLFPAEDHAKSRRVYFDKGSNRVGAYIAMRPGG